MKRVKSVIAVITAVLIVIASMFSGILAIFATGDDYLAYIDFGDSYAAGVAASSLWNYYQSGGSGKISIVDGRAEFAANTNSGNSSGDRSVLLANNKAEKKIESKGKYKIVFDLIATPDMFKNLSSQFIFANNNWGEISGVAKITDKVTDLTVENQVTEGGNNIYTLSKTISAPELSANCNLLLSVYGSGSGTKYYVDNVYIYAAKEYKLTLESGTEIGSVYGVSGGDVATSISDADFDKIGYDFTVTPEKFPSDANEKIVINYSPKSNLSCYVDFSGDWSAESADKYLKGSSYAVREGDRIKFIAGSGSAAFADRAVLLSNDYQSGTVVSGGKYRLTLKLISSGSISEHTLELKYGSNIGSTLTDSSAVFDGDALAAGVKSQKKLSDGKTLYVVDVDITVPSGIGANKNIIASVYGSKQCLLDVAVIRTYFAYNAEDTDGNSLGTVQGFSGDPVSPLFAELGFLKDDYICSPAGEDAFPENATDKVIIKYTEITNILEYIDFGDSYAEKHRSGDYPAWQYVGGDTSLVKWSDNKVSFDGLINAGKSYGDRAVLLTNNRLTTEIKAGRRYQLQFDLLLKGESLESKNIDIRFGADVWNATAYSVSKASEMSLVKTQYDDPYTVYTVATTLIAPVDKNILISVYGNGASGASILKNVYIFEEFSYTCVDDDENPVGTLYAFPGENVTNLIKGSEVDRRGFFEVLENPVAPDKQSKKIKISYEVDPSFVAFIDFGSAYAATSATRYIASGSSARITHNKTAENISVASNSVSGDQFRYRSFVLANDYLNSGLVPGKRYLITFDLTTNSSFDISKYSVSYKSGRYISNGLSSSAEVIYKGTDLLNSVVFEDTSGSNTVYTISLPYVMDLTGWGTYAERNILMSVFGGNNACTIDNIEISLASAVKLNNTDSEDIIGKIGYDFSLPGNLQKKGYTFVDWFADEDFTVPFTYSKFAETDINAYAYFKKVDTQANMDFTAAPPVSAVLGGFVHSIADGNIYALTGNLETAYLNMYNNSNIIQLSPANYYPVTFRYKTEGYSGKVKVALVSAASNSFNKAKNVLATTVVSSSDTWSTGSICATPEILTEGGVKGDYLYFAIEYDNTAGGKIYIDDIVLSQETGVSFNTMGGDSIDKMSGEPGVLFTLPTPVKSGSTFTGWYYDKSLKNKVEGTKICYPTAKKEFTLYASWDKEDSAVTVDGFENYTDEEILNNPNDSEKQVFSVSHSIAKSGNSSMRYVFNPETTKALTPQRSTFKVSGNSGASGKGIALSKDTVYVMSFYVYAKTLNTTLDFTAFTASGDSVLKNGVQVTASGENARISPKYFPKNEWKKVYYVFKSAQKVENADEIYMTVRANSSAVYTEIYIDDVNVEPLADDMGAVAFNSSVYSANLVHMEYNYSVGKIGDPIVFPETYRENYVLENWYTTYRYMKLLSTEYASGVMAAFPQWDISGTVKVSLENAADYPQDGSGKYTNYGGGKVVVNEQASDGVAAYKYVGTENKNWEKVFALKESDGSPLRLVDGNSYVILVDIYLESYGSDFGFNFCTASQDNYYAWNGSTTGSIIVNADTPTGVWITTALTINASFLQPGGFNLFFRHNAGSGKTVVYFDNFRISSIDPKKPTIIINKGLVAGSVDILSGNIGEAYSLPSNVAVEGYDFCGWYSSPALTRPVDPEGVFFETMTVYAKMLPKSYINGFETSTDTFSGTKGGDIDYEIYDKNAPGNSPDNVHSGDKSLHRKGNDYQHKNALIVRKNATLYPGEPYQLSMWVKMDSYDHKNGAIKIASCSSNSFAWDLVGDMQAVIPISDLTDGKWHYVTYNFLASAYYLSLQTPGYCSIYIDDITVKHLSAAGDNAEIVYDEYIPIKKGADGKIHAIEEIIPEVIADGSLTKYEDYQKLLDEYNEYLQADFDDWDDSGDDLSGEVSRVKKKKTTVTQKRNPLTFADILTCNSYVWYTVVFYAGVGAVVLLGAGIPLLIVLLKKKRKSQKSGGAE